ncbi:MAG TPA: peptidase, partial [Thermoanaerobaculia bacterium]|nr:peptidase [Thermoanaerobaculia bacterium]
IRAKYDRMLVPIAARTLAAADAQRVSFDAFFDEVLHHELSHGLGPGTIVKNGQPTEVRLELKELYSTLEEAKADVMGIYNILALVEAGEMPRELRSSLDPTYVAGLFRAARFGVHEAHGQGVVAQFNYLLEKGALAIDGEGRYRTVVDRFPAGIRDLLREMLTLQAEGDYEGTKRFLDRYGHPTPPLEAAIERLRDLPVDLDTRYTQADGLK